MIAPFWLILARTGLSRSSSKHKPEAPEHYSGASVVVAPENGGLGVKVHPTNTSSEEQIKQRAVELWEQRGRPEGHDAEFWTQAERELRLGENRSGATANASSAKSGSGSDGPREKS